MNENNEQNRSSFYKGLVSGLGIAFLISVLSFVGVKIYRDVNEYAKRMNSDSTVHTNIVNDDSIKKLNILEDTINKYYLQDVDVSQMEDGIYKGLLDSLEDPYSVYYTAEELKELEEQTQGIYYGIGAYISQNVELGYSQISKIIEGTPAEESELMAGDIICEINGEDMYGKESSYVVSKIKGEEGTFVTITVFRESISDYLDIEVERRKIESPTVRYEMHDDGIAYIQIQEFDIVTTNQFKAYYKQAQNEGMKGLIIDLRSNPGGNLSTVCEIAREILPKGLIVYTEDKYGERSEYSCDGSKEIKVPLVVMVDGYSASASEILAGAVKDYGIGKLVGTTTFGKGIVQKIISLSDGSAVKITVSNYFTPNGNNIHKKGVEPDVEIEFDAEKYAEGIDVQLDKAEEVLREMMK